jgi:pyrroloquinoline quinone biosynthesis protein B
MRLIGSLFFYLVFFFLFAPRLEGQVKQPFMIVLGVAQDGGFPQAGCRKSCCEKSWLHSEKKQFVSCVAWVDPARKKYWLFDATKDLPEQMQYVTKRYQVELAGIFLTHAHIGHYTGLMHLGREVMGTKQVPVFALPRMYQFLVENGPWKQLVTLKNIELVPLQADIPIQIADWFEVTAIQVPHRDEFSETAGFLLKGSGKSYFYLPDIDKWEKWERPIENYIMETDYSFLDGTFYNQLELPGRNMAEIPHPFIIESMERWRNLPATEKNKIHFIHLNHTNPLLRKRHPYKALVLSTGFKIATMGAIFGNSR